MKNLRLYGAGLLVALLLTLTACVPSTSVPSTRGSGGGGGDSGVGTTWTLRNLAYDLRSVAYGNGTFVAVAVREGGAILTSPDGVTWTRRASGGNSLNGVAYGNNTLVAVGDRGTILTSTDGVNWTARTSGTGYALIGVAYGNGLFVAVGLVDTILTSP